MLLNFMSTKCVETYRNGAGRQSRRLSVIVAEAEENERSNVPWYRSNEKPQNEPAKHEENDEVQAHHTPQFEPTLPIID